MKSVLGIDTSAYTTSMALVDEAGEVVADERLVLKVEQGQRGLRQSEALFSHVKNLPFLFARLEEKLTRRSLVALAASTRPRNVPGSYMPVFLAGESVARSLGNVLGVPFYAFSHQEGHIMAGEAGCGRDLPSKYLAVHFSGGTSEVLLVQPGSDFHYDISILAAGSDLHAGQLVDRVGVRMGLPFPAGRHLEQMALGFSASNLTVSIPAAVRQDTFSFSGAESLALRLLDQGVSREEVAFALLRCIANTLERVIRSKARSEGVRDVLLVGGVMANSLIRQRLEERLGHPAVALRLHFAPPSLSTDNAVGIAFLGWKKWLNT